MPSVILYAKEYQEISKKNKRSGGKFTEEEFLSALKKEDKLHPIVSIVIYYGEKPWDGSLSLKDMMADMPEEIESVFSDYRMNLLQVIDSSKYHFDNEDMQTVFEISENIFERLSDLPVIGKGRIRCHDLKNAARSVPCRKAVLSDLWPEQVRKK